ncbi:hypothetical protein [Granulosicoccus antarcticus]|uniref:Uncharacterized protein n=1 Tax=Granulosicoccus antarcticus IMCC3135 TaxID=1192854 RepID=A0A2Z2P303_9GAMM|nr:hypothetical protein [Granulosicoccus antarcticus]ASJ76728.1 hypothetical protein IMCC3135_33420 [Granulosicoccus antarcticus IMCC3135]
MLHRTRTWRHGRITLTGVSLLMGLLSAPALQAEMIGLVDAQAFDAAQFRRVTLETSVRANTDGTRTGFRVTPPRIAGKVTLFVEGIVVNGEQDNLAINGEPDYSGLGLGGGAYYTGVPDWHSMTVTLQLALHTEETEVDNNLSVSGREATVETRLQSQSLSVLLSPRTALQDNGLNGYLELGLNRTRTEQKLMIDSTRDPLLSDNDTRVRPFVEAGLVLPAKIFRFFAVLGYEEQLSLSLGARLQIGRTPSTPQ